MWCQVGLKMPSFTRFMMSYSIPSTLSFTAQPYKREQASFLTKAIKRSEVVNLKIY